MAASRLTSVGLVGLLVADAMRPFGSQAAHSLRGGGDVPAVGVLEVLDGARVLVAVESADAAVAEAHVVDDRRHQAELERLEGALDVGVPGGEVGEQLAQAGGVERSAEAVQVRQPAEGRGVAAERMEPVDDGGARAVGDVRAGRAPTAPRASR